MTLLHSFFIFLGVFDCFSLICFYRMLCVPSSYPLVSLFSNITNIAWTPSLPLPFTENSFREIFHYLLYSGLAAFQLPFWDFPSLLLWIESTVSWISFLVCLICCSMYSNTVVPHYLQVIHFKTTSGFLKPWIVLNPVYTMFLYIYVYI